MSQLHRDTPPIPRDYRYRVVVQFRDEAEPPPLPGSRPPAHVAAVDHRRAPPGGRDDGDSGRGGSRPDWAQVAQRWPGATVAPMFANVDARRLAAVVQLASQRTRTTIPRMDRWFAVTLPAGADPQQAAATFQRWTGVRHAYVETPPGPEPVSPSDDPRFPSQGYLKAAPGGIDVTPAWAQPGGDGHGVAFVDLERGWLFNHEDLVSARLSLISGTIVTSSRPHGTAVLGILCGVDNTKGVVGIGTRATGRTISAQRTSTRYSVAEAICDAVLHMSSGDVLLLEQQVTSPQLLPVEVEDAAFWWIFIGTLIGITVVEAGANGTVDLDTYSHPVHGRILKRGDPAFRDSGAILVGAGSSAAPHTRLSFSNFGSRVDCYAWGENVETTHTNAAGDPTAYTGAFNGTSSASPIVTGAAISVIGMIKSRTGTAPTPAQVRRILTDPRNSTPSSAPATDRIGVMPDLRKIVANAVLTLPARTPPARTPSRYPPGDYPLPRGDTRYAAVIDAGHGGDDPVGGSSAYGAVGPSGTLEKDVTLALARRVSAHFGSGARLTRDSDHNVGLRDRATRTGPAPIFVSLHANTGRTDRRGPEVWVYGDPTGPSARLAGLIREELEGVEGQQVPVNQGPMGVLDPRWHGPSTAAVLVEADSLVLPQGEARLRDPAHVDRMASAIARGMSRYSGELSG